MADDDETLSEEQLHRLLEDAVRRLRNAESNSQHGATSSHQKSIPKISSDKSIMPYIKSNDHGAKVEVSHLVSAQERKLSSTIRSIQDPGSVRANAAKAKKDTAGSDWYNIPRTKLTPELKRDLQLLRMRSVLDPKRHYKKEASKTQVPEFSQVGTIIEGPTDFFSARLSNKDRKRTLVEEVLAGEVLTHRFKSKYGDIQASKTSGKRAHYRKMKAQRRGGRFRG